MREKMGICYKNNWDYIISVLVTIIPKIIIIVFFSYPLYITGDEIFLFHLPAKLAGLDWTACMTNYRYYGYGFSILLTPLFSIIKNPFVLYKVILIIIALVQSAIPIICCYLLRHCFNITDKKKNTLISVACSYMVVVTAGYMYNEHIYVIGVWLCFLWLAKLNHAEGKKRLLYTALLGGTMVFSLTLHARAITLLLGYIVLYVYMLIFFKKRTGYLSLVLVIYGIGNYFHEKIVAWNNFYLVAGLERASDVVSSAETVVQNTEVAVQVSFKSLFFDVGYVNAILKIVVSQINGLNIRVCGLGVFALILGGYITVKLVQRKNVDWNKYIIVFGVYGISCILITILGQSISWGWGVKEAYLNADDTVDSLRALNYMRYFMAYFPPVLLAMLCYMIKNMKVTKKLLKYSTVVSVFLCLIWLQDVVPLVKDTTKALPAALTFRFKYLVENISMADYLRSAIVAIILIIITYICIRYKKINVFLIGLCVVIVYQYVFSALYAVSVSEKYNYDYVDASYELFREIDFSEYKVYVQHTVVDQTNQGTIYEVQFLNPRIKMYEGYPKGEEGSAYLCFEEKIKEQLLADGYVFYPLDDNEYVYIKGQELQKLVADYLNR